MVLPENEYSIAGRRKERKQGAFPHAFLWESFEQDRKKKNDELTYIITGLAKKLHRRLGRGLLESVYRAALAYE